jgi:hypothetical protein
MVQACIPYGYEYIGNTPRYAPYFRREVVKRHAFSTTCATSQSKMGQPEVIDRGRKTGTDVTIANTFFENISEIGAAGFEPGYVCTGW